MMKKFLRSAALMLAMGGLSASMISLVSSDSNAQEKKEAPKKKDDKKAEKIGSIVIKEGKDGKFRFSIYDGDEKFLGMSGPQGFPTKEDAAKGVERLKAVLKDAKTEYAKKDEVKEKEEDKKEEKKKP